MDAIRERGRTGPISVRFMRFGATCSLAAAVIHFRVAPEHLREFWLFGVVFVVMGLAQAVWAFLSIGRVTRAILVVGVLGNAALVLIWIVSRTVGLPVGPEAWMAEPIGMLDVLSTLLEGIVVGVSALLLRERSTFG